ncbi:MAG: hypothetical protein JST39_17310, partial [Bacteroidetes bacterium]|nr:hypothetical protein [Bacteroidota bacterium]
ASQDEEVGMYGFIRPGDYVLRLMPSHAGWGQQQAVLETCTEYFLQQPEVARLLAVAHEEDARENSVISRAGFVPLSSISTSYTVDNVYEYKRE